MTTPKEALEFIQYRRKQIAELRPWQSGDDMSGISVSAEDTKAGSPKAGDMIARNPKNHADQWLVAAAYFADNFEPVASIQGEDAVERVARTPPGEVGASHNSGEREPSVMPVSSSGGTELRVKARLAWNNWPNTADSRRVIAEHEARDKVSSAAWDRVIAILATGLVPDEVAIRKGSDQ